MTTIREITDTDGSVWSLEDESGDLFLLHTFDIDSPAPRSSMPMQPVILELFAVAARNRTPIHARGQAVIPNVVKFIPGSARSATL